MKEYEYSFQAKNIKPYIKYCEDNQYELIEKSSQVRALYRNTNNTIARITTKKTNNKTTVFLDFKDDNDSDEILKVSRETIPLEITNQEAVESILDFLQYKKDKVLTRHRIVYQNNKVIFELDDYRSPEKMYVVAVEGDKKEVDLVYNEISNI